MRVVFRADASIAIGSGHVMRCLALALALRESAEEILFVCRMCPGELSDFIEQQGYRVLRLPNFFEFSRDAPQNVELWQADARETKLALMREGVEIDWLVVDHYALDGRWESDLRPVATRIMVVDDLADRPHDCDVVLDQNLFAEKETRYDERVPLHCVKLLGPQYALLRPEFHEARGRLKAREGRVRRILVFLGGSDPGNETAKALEGLKLLDRPDIGVDVVVGASNPYRDEIEELCGLLPSVSFYCQVKNMAELMVSADLAIGAGGSAAWERSCLGLPCAAISVADNQDEVARTLAVHGAIRFLGRSAEVSAQSLAQALRQLLDDQAGICAMSEKAFLLVDGRGVQRVAAVLQAPAVDGRQSAAITLRCAQLEDEYSLFEWRNAPEVRSSSFDHKFISWTEHTRWFLAALENPARHVLIGEAAGKPIGVLRYDVAGDEAEVSIYLLPGLSGNGWGTRLLQEGSRWLKRQVPGIVSVRARILPTNKASLKAFAKAGFVVSGEDYLFDLGTENG